MGEHLPKVEQYIVDALAENDQLKAEVERLRQKLHNIALFADSEATDASGRYDANLTDLASSISALRIIESIAKRELEPPVEGVPAQEGSE